MFAVRGGRANRGPLHAEAVRAIFRELLSGSRALLRPKHVVYLGPEYSYSHLAAVEQFGLSSELIPVATIAAVFDAVNRGQADFGLVPIENSTDGRVADTLDMFARLPLRICGEVQLRIHHYLLGKCSRSEVREVYSKPQALSQCRAWLARHLPEARLVEMASTTAAARLATEKPGAAAIASRQAGVNYGLDVIAADIEDNRHNVTRFAVIGDHSAARSGNDKTSLMFELPHQPGVAGRCDGDLQTQPAEPDLDRVLSDAGHPERIPVLRRVPGASRGSGRGAGPGRADGGRRCAWRFSAPTPPQSRPHRSGE